MAEIMVVLFIMTIILAAFAPLMTVRAKSTSRTSPWNWATPDSANTYFGVHPNQRVMIGQKTMGTDSANKLTVNVSDGQDHMLFKKNGNGVGAIYFNSSNSINIGSSGSFNNAHTDSLAFGHGALSALTGSYNVAVGTGALQSNSGGYANTAFGHATLNKHPAGHDNTAVGIYALLRLTDGSYNTAVGMEACSMETTLNRTTCLGTHSGPNPWDNTANTVYVGNPYSTVHVLGYLNARNSNISSDIRLKNIQGDYTSGLEQIKKIKPVKFTFKDDKKKTPRVGVIAQDLQKVFPKAVMKGDDGFLKIRQEDMFYAMINAIKELANRDDAKDKKIKELEARLDALEKSNK